MREDSIREFREVVWDFYHRERRDMPWREADARGMFDPYRIMVSEVMLQQTQVARVVPKFEAFVAAFPTATALAAAPLGDVLRLWSGLGYNRRAKFLHQAAGMIANEYGGTFPATVDELVRLPGIGANTAAAVLVYAYNQPLVFIETNIRTVYIHHFFADHTERVADSDMREYIEATLDREHPREWYWALMDYGTHLKATVGNLTRQSKHYARQSSFEGSRRQLRGRIVRELLERPATQAQLEASIADPRLSEVLQTLLAEGMIHRDKTTYHVAA